MKGVEGVGKAKKRGAGESLEVRRSKKIKCRIVAAARSDGEDSHQLVTNAVQDKVFRFMELPGELRNRIYAHAEAHAHRSFPPLYPKAKSTSRSKSKAKSPSGSRSSRSSASTSSPSLDSPRPQIPYLSLTQVCSQIRSEFRPAWLSTHKIPLSMLASYLKALYPILKPSTPTELREKLESQSSTSSKLRILLRDSELANIDILPLISHSVRFPLSTLTCLAMPGVSAPIVTSIQGLLENKNEAWVRDVHEKRITQVRVMANRDRPWMRIVVKERYAEAWMRDGITKEGLMGEYVGSRGLEGVVEVWRLAFGVEYS